MAVMLTSTTAGTLNGISILFISGNFYRGLFISFFSVLNLGLKYGEHQTFNKERK